MIVLETVVVVLSGLAILLAGCALLGRPGNATRSWSPREWERYQRTGKLPAWDYTSRQDRRRYGR